MTHLRTRAVHAGQHPDPTTGAIATPISQTTAFGYGTLERGAEQLVIRSEGLFRDVAEVGRVAYEGRWLPTWTWRPAPRTWSELVTEAKKRAARPAITIHKLWCVGPTHCTRRKSE